MRLLTLALLCSGCGEPPPWIVDGWYSVEETWIGGGGPAHCARFKLNTTHLWEVALEDGRTQVGVSPGALARAGGDLVGIFDLSEHTGCPGDAGTFVVEPRGEGDSFVGEVTRSGYLGGVCDDPGNLCEITWSARGTLIPNTRDHH
jgi:hypothetical protein